jgi:hypothetical protein
MIILTFKAVTYVAYRVLVSEPRNKNEDLFVGPFFYL